MKGEGVANSDTETNLAWKSLTLVSISAKELFKGNLENLTRVCSERGGLFTKKFVHKSVCKSKWAVGPKFRKKSSFIV